MPPKIDAEPYRIDVPDSILADLDRRLAATRWPNQPDDARWQYGANRDYMQDLVAYWRDGFDWRKVERDLNEFTQYRAAIDDHLIHFIVEAGKGPAPLPLVITHGWPSSFVEMLDIIGPLADPAAHGGDAADAFDVIVPSLPGYPMSSLPPRPIGPRAIAGLWHRLMSDVLGYDGYYAHGGDWGSLVNSWLAFDHPETTRAIHLTMIGLAPGRRDDQSEAEVAWRGEVKKRLGREGAYQHIQRTKPQTLAYGLTDSPVGLAAWLIEKFHGWPGGPADAPPPFNMDRLLTNVMLYWVHGSINAANWLYRAAPEEGGWSLPGDARVETPTGFAFPPRDLVPPPPDEWIARAYNCVHRTDLEKGGHFQAQEEPEQLIADIRAFFRRFR
jgi:microsomal epoxide hydrolase